MKFSIGEVCEVGPFKSGEWKECRIICFGAFHSNGGISVDYTIYVPSIRAPENDDNYWNAAEEKLRKKRPSQDMSEFTFDELINNVNKVPA